VTIDDLYAVPLEDFVAARDDLARELAAAGDDDEAKRVKSLRKPTITAWTLNHLARERPDLIAALVEAHAALRSADSAGAMRAASEARMDAIRLIVAAPEEATEAVRKKMRSTLLATATDAAAEEALLAGRLQSELEPGGLGGFDLASELATAAPPAARAPKAKAGDRQKGGKAESARAVKARERVERMQQEADEAAAEARTLRAEADRAERLATSAEERAAKKQVTADAAREKLEED
jgi:hypothetical protein